jgi:TatD DNase family protein
MLVDTHCHLDFPEFNHDLEPTLQRAQAAGIGKFINISASLASCRASLTLSEKHPPIYCAIGVHPHDAKDLSPVAYAEIEQLVQNKKVVAVGEVGLDFYRNLSPKEKQFAAFRKFIQLAKKYQLPLIIHCREAFGELTAVLEEEKYYRGAIHCFSGDEAILEKMLGIGFSISFTANITYAKAENLRRIVAKVPLEKLLLETDCPFLAPQEKRGKRNEPAYLVYAARKIAEIKNISWEELAQKTTANAEKLFRLI